MFVLCARRIVTKLFHAKYVQVLYKKCTKIKPKQLKCLNPKEWVCSKCSSNTLNYDSDIEEEVNNLSESPYFNITEIALEKYDKMVFNPLGLIVILQQKSITTLLIMIMMTFMNVHISPRTIMLVF